MAWLWLLLDVVECRRLPKEGPRKGRAAVWGSNRPLGVSCGSDDAGPLGDEAQQP